MSYRLGGHFGWFLVFGIAGLAGAAENLPPLSVDPALLGLAPSPVKRMAPPTAPGPAPAPLPAVVSPTPPPVPPVSVVAAPVPEQPARQPQLADPPVVAEQPALPPTYSAHVAAGELSEPELKATRGMTPLSKVDGQSRPSFLSADYIWGKSDVETVAEGNAEIRRIGTTIESDRLSYRHADDEVEAVGHVRLTSEEDVITGPRMRMRLEDSVGFFEKPEYVLKRLPVGASIGASAPSSTPPREPVIGSGAAERIDFEGEGLFRMTSATYSTCAPTNRDWYAEVDEMWLDYNREVGEAKQATVYFKGVPLLHSPWLSFSLNNQRKSGLLTPTYGSTTQSGLDITVPWYWNIAPNMDATITPRIMSKRGIQLNNEFRYLDHNYSGQARYEILPEDRVTRTRRSAYSLVHSQNFGRGFSGGLNINGASDDAYFSDLSTRLSVVTQTNLLRQGSLSYGGGWWNASLMAQRYQTLQDPAAPTAVPYYRLPQLTVSAARADLPFGAAFGFSGEYVNFDHPTNLLGKRTVLYPQVSLPMQASAFSITPKIGLHMTRYALERQAAGTPAQITRNVPIFSIDSGVAFERDTEWFGQQSLIQTLEPRLYYLYVPVREQSQIPVFDSGRTDFNFAQIFAENRYGGSDRIGDANQATLMVTSRLLDPASGIELLRGAVGQRFYFTTEHVILPGETARSDRKTDLLASLSGRVLPKTYIDAGWQYNPNKSWTERLNFGGRYQPETGRVLNAGYRYTRDQLGQIDVSGQWPLFGGWHGVGRYNYSTKERRVVETVGGLEYDGGCWAARFVVQRIATQANKSTTALFFQLELNGFSRIGSNPLDLLKRNIPGYGIINQPTADPIFGAN
ncbi:MAG: LPS-assembly protein LptD [Candidatus Nitricoxidivorans perseverans]|uniref:LPS-assembly protein LptD n=1 Tax=Candidatus Nitricoxidivorans perseverans TaxID=2975601 RepID=A0AA49IYF9_9PROT|nr:MAG: LPS-assembly protein LptD [Candidatus Nitricoxidivorans perseverans]